MAPASSEYSELASTRLISGQGDIDPKLDEDVKTMLRAGDQWCSRDVRRVVQKLRPHRKCFSAVLFAVGLVCWFAAPHSTLSHIFSRMRGSLHSSEGTVATGGIRGMVTLAREPACAADRQNCKSSHCCGRPGTQCYRKNKTFAGCKRDCRPGPDPADTDSGPWSCEKLGARASGEFREPLDCHVPEWVASTCAKSGKNCTESRCCAQAGMQCYAKSDHWAACKATCNPGPDPSDINPHPWSCKKLGSRTPGSKCAPMTLSVPDWVESKCSKRGTDCTATRCCSESGMQCYEKEPGWATCKAECTPGPDPQDRDPNPWSCKEYGGRTPGTPEPESPWVPEWVLTNCSKPGDDCTHTKCCATEGMQCFEKHGSWAICREECKPGPDPTDPDPAHWTCKPLGGRTAGEAPQFRFSPELPKWASTHCSEPGEDCRATKCCTYEGLQCFEKHARYATCKPVCRAGPDTMDVDPHPWTCEEIGSRMPGKAPHREFFWNRKIPEWLGNLCTATGGNCAKTRCCAEKGMQCYAKQKGWATCRPSCTPGRDPIDANSEPWSCEKLGMRTPGKIQEHNLEVMKPAPWVATTCAKDGENCHKHQCCRTPGMQCYTKAGNWSICKATCSPGAPEPTDINPDPWSCRKLGGRTPGKLPKPPRHLALPKWLNTHCAAVNKDCHEVRCCRDKGMQCYEKNQHWGLCQATCTPGVDPTDSAGGEWTCRELGVRTPKPWASPTLFCFTVLRDSGYEPDLMRVQFKNGAGIFACEDFVLMCAGNLKFNSTVDVLTFPPANIGVSSDGTAGNTELFLHAWDRLKADGRLTKYDWTVKVDPDAVLLPDRLRDHLRPHTNANVFIVNCDKPDIVPMMFGALEAFSKQAMATFFSGMQRCTQDLSWQQWGEDKFMGNCLSHLGVSAVNDFTIYTDGVCKGMNCADKVAAAFHPVKKLSDWLFCWTTAMNVA